MKEILLAIATFLMIIVVAVVGALNIDKAPIFNLVLLAGLIGVTTWYAYSTIKIAKATEKQADASVKMAEEMREQRYNSFLPIIDIQRFPLSERSADRLLLEGDAAHNENYSCGISLVFSNIGVGPATDVSSFILNPANGERVPFNFGTLEVGGKTDENVLSIEQENNRTALVVTYRDVYGRTFESSREISVNRDTSSWEVSSLKIRLVNEVGNND